MLGVRLRERREFGVFTINCCKWRELIMAGTVTGGQRAAKKNMKKYGKDFYARIGAKGGRRGHTGGFAAGKEGRERARKYGSIGGKISRRNARREIE
jgi:hypothetical protein